MPLLLRDPSGCAIIEPGRAEARLPVDYVAVDRDDRALLDHLDPTTASRDTLRHVEHVVRPGDRLVVIGQAVREPEPAADGAPRLRLRHTKTFPLLLLTPTPAA